MDEDNKEIFLTALNNEKEIASLDFNDDEMDIDVKSSADSEDTPRAKDEIEQILNKKQTHEISSILIPHGESFDGIENKMPINGPSTSIADENIQRVIPREVYDYAAMVNHTLESPRQSKLDYDVTTILGSSDPPPGFGFLHPRFYYLEQKRPIPLEPLQVWRGYNGHVYFQPIQVQQLESDRITLLKKPLKSVTVQSNPFIRKKTSQRPNTLLSEYKNRTSGSHNNIKERINNERFPVKKRSLVGTTTNTTIIPINNELRNQTSSEVNNEVYNLQESTRMWQSVVTSAHVQAKPMSKRSQNAMEDLQALQQEQSLQDPTGYNRQVLPNIRPIPRSKFVYKGLAYKESQKLPGISSRNDNDNDGNALQKPLIAYNLAQAYARYEINAARAKQNLPQQPSNTATGGIVKQSYPLQTSIDLRERRKRIIRGTTLAYQPPTQSVAWTPGRADHRSTLGSQTTYYRPSTSKSKSSIPQKQTAIIQMPILTTSRRINQQRDSSRYTPTTELVAAP